MLICFPINGKSDVPILDIAKVEIDGSKYYMRYQSQGLLKEGDLNYYNYFGDHQPTVEEVVKRELSYTKTYSFYKELHRVIIKNVPGGLDDTDGILYILKGEIEMSVDSIIDSIKILSAENGNFAGFIYSEDLSEVDNQWLTSNPIEEIYTFSGFVICNMSLYAIKGSVDEIMKREVIQKIDASIKQEERDLLEEELHKLYKRQVIMIGICSC